MRKKELPKRRREIMERLARAVEERMKQRNESRRIEEEIEARWVGETD
jgi:hypothetical protein